MLVGRTLSRLMEVSLASMIDLERPAALEPVSLALTVFERTSSLMPTTRHRSADGA